MKQTNLTSKRKRVALATLGCKVNQFDSDVIREQLDGLGFEEVPFAEKADVYIVNTCTVTGKSDYQSRQLIRRARRLNPAALVIATGCYAEVAPDAVGVVEGVSAVLGNQDKHNLASLVSALTVQRKPFVRVSSIPEGPLRDASPGKGSGRARASLKIQDGCESECSYCIVPRARGRSRSLPPRKVLDHLARLLGKGYMEVVLTGVHLGSYGLDLSPSTSLLEMIENIEKTRDLPPRIRLSSIEPTDFSVALVQAIGDSKRICPHLHIPLQSGDDAILRRMNRDYTREGFEGLIRQIVEKVDRVSVGLDVIAGFPGEDENQFRNTLCLVNDLPAAYLHVFPFSPRPGTAAFAFPDRVRGEKIRRRCAILRDLGQRKREAFYSRHVHRKVRILVEKTTVDENGRHRGISRNYIPVWIEPDKSGFSNDEIDVEITQVKGPKVLGKRTKEKNLGI
jgi:threonylcarbamoyladenosine tRNA methylthiotransferase MtaB